MDMYSLDNVGRNTIAMVLAGGKGERLSPLQYQSSENTSKIQA
jgi:glucose-1-phosphate adenylyltransferase